MKKIKQLFRKGVALALAAVTTLSVLPAATVSAASQRATITFAYCYDGNGNTIRYQQTASHNGVTFSHAGEARTRIYADGDNAYCIEPGISLHTGNTLEKDASVVWNNLGKAKQDAVNLALLYGAQGSMGSLSGTEDEKVLATQMVIWEIVTGCRNATAPYAQTDAKFYNSLCVGGANSGIAAAYQQIISGMVSHGTIPSFASGSTDSAPQELKWDGKQYVLKLTDSNGVLSKFNFTSSNSDVKVSKSGNTLTVTSSKAIAGNVQLSATKKIPTVSSSAKLIAYGDPSLQDIVTGVENTAAVKAYLNVKIPYGHIQIVKTSEDGVVVGLKFQITGNGIDQTVTTGEDGTIKVENLQPGTYTVTELTENRYEPQKAQTVEVKGGETAAVDFSNILKRGDLKVTKTSEDGLVEGMKFHLYGTSLSGIPVDEYAVTDNTGVAMFSDILISGDTTYTLEEVETADRYVVPADQSVTVNWNLSVANFSYTIYDGNIYYRENSRMKPVELSVTAQNRVKGMIAIRDCTRDLIAFQTEGYPDQEIENQQKKLNALYDRFQKKYGLLNSRANSIAFSDDSSYPLLCSLEIVGEDGTLERKADMFTKRTIKPHETVTKVDTASEALSLSLSEKACVDMDYLCSLTGKSVEEVEQELKGVIFRLPESEGMEQPRFVSEDEYLSGNVRKKLRAAKLAAEISEVYQSNVEALEKVQPKDLTASEISVRLGATWIPEEDIAEFMFELLQTPNYSQWKIKVHFSRHTGDWNVEGKSVDRGNPRANNTYGTNRVNAYKIIEDSLNLRDTRVYDYVEDEEGRRKPILNQKETAIAQGKQDLIKQAFQEWIWKDPERRQRLTRDYNERFNAIRPREYDGSHLHFYGMNPEISLRKHQKDGVARIIYGGNTLLAYVVGAGKTYTMVAAAMECKRLGLCNKSMIVVPNHIIEQFAAEWLQLYPAANILVATKKDFEKKNRKKFCGRIATSDIDAVIIGHSQFEKIPLSLERQERMLEAEIDEIVEGIAEAKRIQGSRFTIKQMERTKKTLETRLKRLHDQSRKDDMITFEELGVDRLFVDEADGYKNLYLTTKMRNVGGIA